MKIERKDVAGFEKYYQVSTDGRVFSKGRTFRRKNGVLMRCKPKELLQCDNGNGYMTVMLYGDNGGKRVYVHRLVAQAFVDNPLELEQVNHKDENKKNNNVENLEWCSAKYNINYGGHTERTSKSNSRTVVQCTNDGEIVETYMSAMEAMRKTGIKQGSISQCCQGKRKSAGGYLWRLG